MEYHNRKHHILYGRALPQSKIGSEVPIFASSLKEGAKGAVQISTFLFSKDIVLEGEYGVFHLYSFRRNKALRFKTHYPLQQSDAGFFASFNGLGVPDAGLDFTDMGAAHHQHTQPGLTDTAANGQRQFII